jgi:hypothetical protein
MGTKRIAALTILLIVSAGLTLAACGSSDNSGSTRSAQEQRTTDAAQRARQRARRRHEARATARRAAARLRIRAAHQAAVRQRHSEEREARLAAAEVRQQEEAEASEAESECDPNYSGACLNPHASDYDCEGGSGNGPYYTGEVSVVGEDHYGLDADGDGVGCEPY